LKRDLNSAFTPNNDQRNNADKQETGNNSDDDGSIHFELLSHALRVLLSAAAL
jgi:hypothetical protein